MRPTTSRKRFGTSISVTSGKLFKTVIRKAIMAVSSDHENYLLGALRANQFERLLEWSEQVSPQQYSSPAFYFADAQIAALIKKYPFTTTEIPGLKDPGVVAFEKFQKAENRCKRMNAVRIAKRKRHYFEDRHHQYWVTARRYILRVLGSEPNLEDIFDHCDFSAGASIGVHGNKTSLAHKIGSEAMSGTTLALPLAVRALWHNCSTRNAILPGRVKCYDKLAFASLVKERLWRCTDYNKVSFVPKTARTHRGIAIEPLLNGYLQKGIDTVMRKKLMRFGVNLQEQGVNRQLALIGSLPNQQDPYCTIDLQAASDSISFEVVKDLLPPAWFDLLIRVRSPGYTTHDNSYVKYEKFCSMGNGFCFPLESLIFAAFTFSVTDIVNNDYSPYDFSVYGDDIIVRQSCALLLSEVLRNAGFILNKEKSFLSGPFRESCGADWYQGTDVRPVFLKDRLVDLRQLFAFHNSFLRSLRCESASVDLRQYLRSLTKGRYQRPGREPGDTAFSVSLDIAMTCSTVKWNRELQSWSWTEILSTAVLDGDAVVSRREPSGSFDVGPPAASNKYWKGVFYDTTLMAILRGSSPSLPYALRYSSIAKRKSVCRPWLDNHVPFINKGAWNDVNSLKPRYRLT